MKGRDGAGQTPPQCPQHPPSPGHPHPHTLYRLPGCSPGLTTDLFHPSQEDVCAPPVVQGDLQADPQRPAEASSTVGHKPHSPLLLRLGCEVADSQQQGHPHGRGGQHLPPQGLRPPGPPCRWGPEVSPEDGSRGRLELQPAVRQDRVEVTKLRRSPHVPSRRSAPARRRLASPRPAVPAAGTQCARAPARVDGRGLEPRPNLPASAAAQRPLAVRRSLGFGLRAAEAGARAAARLLRQAATGRSSLQL